MSPLSESTYPHPGTSTFWIITIVLCVIIKT